MTATTAEAAPRERGQWFGHPKGLTFLFGTEMWERFSYYGMRALLVLYLTKYLLLEGTVDQVIGYTFMKSLFESFSGPLTPQQLASFIYGTYTSLVYLTPIIGGWIADQFLGQRKTVIIGALLMALGHFLMALESMLFFALLALILGNGAFKPNIATQIGNLYPPGDSRRDRAYSVFYVGVNLGAFFSPLVCGTLGETYGWHYGFGAAGVGMLIGLFIYMFALQTTPPDALTERKKEKAEKKPFTRRDWGAVIGIIVLVIPVVFFWATYEQQGNTIALFAADNTDRMIFGFEIPVTWFQSFNPFMIFAFTPFLIALWGRQAKKGTEPNTVVKMAIGCFGVALAYLFMVGALNAIPEGGGKVSWMWLFGFFVIITIAELYLSPVGLSLVNRLAPTQIASLLMGIWFLTSFFGNFLAGYLGTFWETMPRQDFFILMAEISGAAGGVILLLFPFLKPLLKEAPAKDIRAQQGAAYESKRTGH